MIRKGCLRSPAPSPNLGATRPRKCVVFCPDGAQQVHIADEWDRTPTEPSGKLSYQDMLEFNAIQRSLPLANQPPDPYTGKPAKQYLSTVPLGLLPLLPDPAEYPVSSPSPVTSPATPSPTSASSTPTTPKHSADLGLRIPQSENFPRTVQSARAQRNWHPPDLAHLPSRSQPPRAKSKFSFVPLLDTPPNSAASTPMSSAPASCAVSPVIPDSTESTPALTNSSCNSSPGTTSEPKSMDPHCLPHAVRSLRLEAIPSPILAPPSPLCLDRTTPTARYGGLFPRSALADQDVLAASSPLRRKKKSIIVVNDMEIELDEDDEEDEEVVDSTPVKRDFAEPHKTVPISIPHPHQRSSSMSSTSTVSSLFSTSMSHSTSCGEDENCQAIHSPLASPASSVSNSPLCSPSSSPVASSSLKTFRPGCSPIKYSSGRKSSPLLVPSA